MHVKSTQSLHEVRGVAFWLRESQFRCREFSGACDCIACVACGGVRADHGQLYAQVLEPEPNTTSTTFYQPLPHLLYSDEYVQSVTPQYSGNLTIVTPPLPLYARPELAPLNLHPVAGASVVSAVAVSANTVAVVQGGQLHVFGRCDAGQTGVSLTQCTTLYNGTVPFPSSPRHPCDSNTHTPPLSLDPALLVTPASAQLNGNLSSYGVIRLIAVSNYHTVVSVGSALVTFGACGYVGRDGCTPDTAHLPLPVPTLRMANGTVISTSSATVYALSVGDAVSAVVADGLLFTWGPCTALLGRPCDFTDASPLQVSGGDLQAQYVTDVAVGSNHVAVIANGALFTFGLCGVGALGFNDSTCDNGLSQMYPVHVPLLDPLTELPVYVLLAACGEEHTLVLTDSGLFGFGACMYGQLGSRCPDVNENYTALNTYTPQLATDLPIGSVQALYASGDSSVIVVNGKLWVFGDCWTQPLSAETLFDCLAAFNTSMFYPDTNFTLHVPRPVTLLSNVTALALSAEWTAAVAASPGEVGFAETAVSIMQSADVNRTLFPVQLTRSGGGVGSVAADARSITDHPLNSTLLSESCLQWLQDAIPTGNVFASSVVSFPPFRTQPLWLSGNTTPHTHATYFSTCVERVGVVFAALFRYHDGCVLQMCSTAQHCQMSTRQTSEPCPT